MDLLNNLNTTRIIQAFSWMLIHSLWQGLLLAVAAAVVLMVTRKASSALRYNLALALFVFFLAGCGFTFVHALDIGHTTGLGQDIANGIAAKAGGTFHLDVAGMQAFGQACVNYFSVNAPFVVLLWFVLFLFRSVKFIGGVVYIQRVRYRKVSLPGADWQQRVDVLCRKLQLSRAVRLLESGYVKVPLVIGHLKPVILMPVGLLAGLPPEQVEAVLLHELAHIRRNDYVVNFLQTIAETVFFFNPGLMWISSLLREERENCCDDMALAQTQNKRGFVEALISFKEYSLQASGYSVAFPGTKNQLLQRVSRIMLNRHKTLAPAEKGFVLGGIVMLSVMLSMVAVAQMKSVTRTEHKTSTATVETVKQQSVDQKTATTKTVNTPTRRGKPQTAVANPPKPGTDMAELLKQKRETEVAALYTDKQREFTAPPQNFELTDAAAKQKLQSESDMLQMKRDKEQADRDMRQAALDQVQAMRDQEQARKDQIQAKLDAEQAARDQAQAMKDLEQARKDQQKAKQNSQQQSIQL
ncbi:M56 family metallopeptidase [Mucilaginibacter pedocola]|uniref:Peptidase M56 domain-containing protein n=1 Tax=Mucilaginibacter pedocola TaxID=1792845 RepID=A0A1S9PCV5_9SPHI|nr:M56 family metallopeptidase [Mucilaginibacter pedocola]OOQ58657.1 hypothetical protein BC343_08305 [Mucilaginibacter pedocola]